MATHTFRVRTDQVAALIRAKKEAVREAVRLAAYESAQYGITLVRADSPVDQGFYKNSWTVVQYPDGSVELRNDAPHAGIIELGARPGFWPPLGPLIEWVLRHKASFNLTEVSRKGGSKRSRTRRIYTKTLQRVEAIRIARAIQRKIHARGIPPKRVLFKALTKMRVMMQRLYERRLAEIASRP